jgi:hypothetical protein
VCIVKMEYIGVVHLDEVGIERESSHKYIGRIYL